MKDLLDRAAPKANSYDVVLTSVDGYRDSFPIAKAMEPDTFVAYLMNGKTLPQEHGYHGPIHILVGMDLTAALTGVIVTYDSEPYGYFSVEPPKFAAQFKGKTIRDPFIVGRDVDAVSRASISISSATRAIRDSSRMVAKQLLPDAVK